MPPPPPTRKKRERRKKKEAKSSPSEPPVKLSRRQKKHSKRRRYRFMSILPIALGIAAKYYMDRRNQSVAYTQAADFVQNFACQQGYCHPNLVPHQRTQKAIRAIAPGKKVIEIPQSMQIWDLDALRDDFIQAELKSSQHENTGNPIEAGAFLAAHLWKRFVLERNETDPLLPYYDILPSYSDLEEFHPTLWYDADLLEYMHVQTSASAVIRGYREMMNSELKSFKLASKTFRQYMKDKDYLRLRLLVLSRSFGTGPPKIPQDELEFYNNTMGIDLSDGGQAMVPLLDMYNHHANPNMEWRLDPTTESFVVQAGRSGIAAGQEVVDSYGKYTDAHLFAKFGFVNGDGSGYTQATIASMHRLLDLGLGSHFQYLPKDPELRHMLLNQQLKVLGRYLQFDEGYEKCIKDPNDKGWEVKQLKLKHLSRLASRHEFWIMHMKPRDATSLPAISSDVPITTNVPKFDFENLELNGKHKKILSLCRFLALTWEDYDGKAVESLKAAWEDSNEPLVVNYQSDRLEYRALMILLRLVGLALHRYGKDLNLTQEMARVERLNKREWGSGKWAATHVRLGELQTLDLLYRLAISGSHEYANKISTAIGNVSPTEIQEIEHIRSTPCEWNYTMDLIRTIDLE